ncbi:ABC transporter ATP-binding protein [Nocardia panacis]|uniref:ABC transporter ATP-binding protein n=1 Tax=Nocardia panacis TaxID=2340916 RepID=A0A3A4K5I3_9NOCA|nr:zinc ABC transporter ATP-binding protein AztA [Nocardia panacis]RJO73771.1 ABC transporter ATP-binding protein [Nocardia panacis]
MREPAIRIDAVSVRYGRHTVLRDISATIPAGRVTALVGPNGSGKSTLLATIAGVVEPAAGTITRTDPPAFVVQHSAVPDTLPITVRETVTMGRWAKRGPWRPHTRTDRAIVRDCLDRMGITDLAHRRLTTLSGGQRQRAMLAQALAQQSKLLLLDEPTTGLDIEARQQISHLLREIADTGITVVQATHDPDEAERCDHRLRLDEGQLIA